MKRKLPTPTQKERWNKIIGLGCSICARPAEIHHLTGAGMGIKSSHYDTIPLCPDHHRLGGYGVAIHAGKKGWERAFGLQETHLEAVNARIKRGEND